MLTMVKEVSTATLPRNSNENENNRAIIKSRAGLRSVYVHQHKRDLNMTVGRRKGKTENTVDRGNNG